MRQVPQALLVGNGRLATHLHYYFSQYSLPIWHWHRDSAADLKSLSNQAEIIFLAISDAAIAEFAQKPELNGKHCIHFSGATTLENITACHPLMTFATQLYTLAEYEKIPFICDRSDPLLQAWFAPLPNPLNVIPQQCRSRYHALCVLSGNFSVLLWQKLSHELSQMGLTQSDWQPYCEQILKNILHDVDAALTGPLARDDQPTLQANLEALADDPYAQVYQAFVNAYQQEQAK